MNPVAQDLKALLQNLPKIWKLESRVTGADLGFVKFQFVFEREEDIEGVLRHQPYHFDYWMLALARWQPRKDQRFPTEIPFWVRLFGVPTDFRTTPTYESIGDAIGRTVDVDLENGRVQVVVDAFKELCFETTKEASFMMRWKLMSLCAMKSSLAIARHAQVYATRRTSAL